MSEGRRQQPPTKYHAVPVRGKTCHDTFHVDERYNDLKIIGSGSYGVVCSAVDSITQTKVAIKKVVNALEDLVDAGRVLRELRLLRHIDGRENTLKIRDTYTYPPDTPNFEDVYIVTDLLETDLDRILRSSQGLSSQHFRYFLYQLLRSVANMHRASVLHRDLKPSNLLVNANCDLVVCDFGLARGVSNTSRQLPDTARADGSPEGDDDHLTEYVVTRWYRPPEILGESLYYGAAADIWSVGCIFGEMMDKRRQPIFRGSCAANQMKRIVSALGIPTEAQIERCTCIEARASIRRVCKSVKKEGHPRWNLQERFPEADPLSLDLLEKMLVFDPKERITADEALKHPFLQEVHNHWDKMGKIEKFDFSFEKHHHDNCKVDNRCIPKLDLQYLFLHEVNKYRVVRCRIPTPLHLMKSESLSSLKALHGSAQVSQLSSTKSNQQLESLPMITGARDYVTSESKDKETRGNSVKGGAIVKRKKSGISETAAKIFRKQTTTAVPSGTMPKRKTSISDGKNKTQSRNGDGKRPGHSSALRSQAPGPSFSRRASRSRA
jgi:mitogen-activated protein kinase 1/3